MSIRGVSQLVRLELNYCSSSGSSAGAREFIRSELPQFHSAHSALPIDLVRKSNRHPVLIGHYLNGRRVLVPLRGKAGQEVLQHAKQLRASIGRTSPPRYWPLAQTRSPSIQGHWSDACHYVPLQDQVTRLVQQSERIIGVAQPKTENNEKQSQK